MPYFQIQRFLADDTTYADLSEPVKAPNMELFLDYYLKLCSNDKTMIDILRRTFDQHCFYTDSTNNFNTSNRKFDKFISGNLQFLRYDSDSKNIYFGIKSSFFEDLSQDNINDLIIIEKYSDKHETEEYFYSMNLKKFIDFYEYTYKNRELDDSFKIIEYPGLFVID